MTALEIATKAYREAGDSSTYHWSLLNFKSGRTFDLSATIRETANGIFVAYCAQLDLVVQGDSAERAKRRMEEAAEITIRADMEVGAEPLDRANKVVLSRIGPVEVSLPGYQSEHAAGMDLEAAIAQCLELAPGQRSLVPTGISLNMPPWMEGQIRPRSGLALKCGVTVLNAPGTIDADYRGEVKVLLINLSNEWALIEPLQRIAQIVFAKVERVKVRWADALPSTSRGEGGFGSTG